LTVADIDRPDLRCAVLQQTVGEPAGARANIEANEAGGIDAEVAEGAFQFVPAPPHVSIRRGDGDDGGFVELGTGFVDNLLADPDLPSHDGALRFLTTLEEAADDEKLVEALFAWHAATPLAEAEVARRANFREIAAGADPRKETETAKLFA
jgi:hypothetical protein